MKVLYQSVVVFSLFILSTSAFSQASRSPQAVPQHGWGSQGRQQTKYDYPGPYSTKGIRAGDTVVIVHNTKGRLSDDDPGRSGVTPSHRHFRSLRRGQKLTVLFFTKAFGFWALLPKPQNGSRRVWVNLGDAALEHRSAH